MHVRRYWNKNGSSFLFVFSIVLLVFFVFRFSVSARELRNYDSGKEQTLMAQEIPKEYHFSAQIQRDEKGKRSTEFVPFGMWDNEQKEHADIPGDFVITRITGDGGKGTLGAWYYNVGTYQGKVVDLKCTVADYMQKAGPNDTTGTNLGWIAMSAEQLGIYIRHLQWVEIKMEFYDAETGNPLTVQSSAVLTDIDDGEGVMLLSECENWQVSEACKLQILVLQEKQVEENDLDRLTKSKSALQEMILYESEEKTAYNETKDSWAQVQVLFQGSEFRYRMYSKLGMEHVLEDISNVEHLHSQEEHPLLEMEETGCKLTDDNEEIQKQKSSTENNWSEGVNGPEPPEFMLHFQGYSDCRLAPLTTGDGVLTVEDSDEIRKENCTLYHREEDFVYELSYTVSPEYQNWYYDSFTVCAQLPREVKFFSGEVYTSEGKCVSDQFFIRESEGSVFFEAKKIKQDSFYGKTYEFAIHGNVKKDVNLEGVWNGKRYTLPIEMQIKIERNGNLEEKKSNQAYINISSEYIEGKAKIVLKDCLSGAMLTDGEVVLYEWDEGQQAYKEVKRTTYDKDVKGYEFQNLTKNHSNQGKYKVSVSRVPEHYLGVWEQELTIDRNKAVYEVTGEHQPTGKTLIRMTSKVIRTVEGEEHVSAEYGSQDHAVSVRPGDKIQYHIYVERDSALTYKSGELLVKNKIPEGLLYDKATLNLIGEIQHPVENSTAKIASVLLNKEGELTWKINFLDEGEIAHVIFEVTVPEDLTKEDVKSYVDYAKLKDGDQIIASNVLEHQLEAADVVLSMTSTPQADVTIHPRESVQYTMHVKNTSANMIEQVLVRLKVPEGMRYQEGTLSSQREDVKLQAIMNTEEGRYELVYGVIPKMLPGETVSVDLKLWIENTKKDRTVEVIGEIYESGAFELNESQLQNVVLKDDGFVQGGSIRHKVEQYPEIEPPVKEEDSQINPPEDNKTPIITPEEVIPDEKQEQSDEHLSDKGKINKTEAAKTGDGFRTEIYWVLSVGAMLVLSLSWYFYNYKRKKRKYNIE